MKKIFLGLLFGLLTATSAFAAYMPQPNVYYASAAGTTEAGLLAADATCAAKNYVCALDASYTLTTDRTLSATWQASGGVITLAGHTLTLSKAFSASPTMQMFSVASGGALSAPLPPRIYGEWFGAKGDGTTNDSAALNAALTFAGTGARGTVQLLPKVYVANVTVPNGVTLTGSGDGPGYIGSVLSYQSTIQANATGVIVDTATGSSRTIQSIHITNLNLRGLGSAVPLVGIKIEAGNDNFVIRNVFVTNTADQSIYTDTVSQAGVFENILTNGALLNQTRASIAAACEIHGLDHVGRNLECGNSQATFSTNYNLAVPLFTAGIWIDGTSDDNFTDMVGEASDTGIYITGTSNTFRGLKPNFNFGHGLIDNSSNSQYIGTRMLNNGRAAASTYDCFYKLAGSGVIDVEGLQCYTPGGDPAVRYAITDNVTYGALLGGNQSIYSHVMVSGSYSGQTYNFADSFIGPRVSIPAGGWLILTQNSTTPSVDNYQSFRTNNTVSTAISNFTNGVNGQIITVSVNDANTTIPNGSTIHTIGGTTISTQGTYMFEKYQTVWRQLSAGAS